MRNRRWKPYTEDRQAQKRRIRQQILFVQWLFIALFALMGTYICFYAYTHKEEFFDNSYNGRQAQLLSRNVRGKIYSADQEILAETVTGEDGTETRSYPYGALFAHVVGFDSMGRSGLENAENYALIHADLTLAEKAEYDRKKEKYPGNDVTTTLRTDLQQAADDALGMYTGAILVTDPSTGDILAMISKPDFDPNTVRIDWDSLITNQKGVLLNRVTQGQYPPGSTFKIVDAIEYLEEHPDDWQNYRYQCTGTLTRGEGTVHCFHYERHGEVDLVHSFAESCNCSFANIGLMLDRASYEKTLSKLMFDEALPFSYPYEKSHVALEDTTSEQELIQIAIGQGKTSMSPLHLNLITQAAANDGVLMRPRLVKEIRSASGTLLEKTETAEYGRLMSSETAVQLREMMKAVVEEGTATKLSGFSYTAAGKTGSAEYDGEDESKSHAWFTGFAPAENPEVCVTVIIEGAGSGGDYAVPVARRVFDRYFED